RGSRSSLRGTRHGARLRESAPRRASKRAPKPDARAPDRECPSFCGALQPRDLACDVGALGEQIEDRVVERIDARARGSQGFGRGLRRSDRKGLHACILARLACNRMPEANVLYAVTAVVVAGLLAWVAVVMRSAKEPWARAPEPPADAKQE